MITQEKRKNIKFSAVILAAGSGSRMKSDLPKQYMPLCGRPLITYAIDAFAEGDIDEIVLVCTPGDKDYMQDEILGRYCEEAIREVPGGIQIVEGGSERAESVLNGVRASQGEYVLIHDGARAFIDQETIGRIKEAVENWRACVAAVPEKNTIKFADDKACVESTPDRSRLWEIQTPQAFERELLLDAYDLLLQDGEDRNLKKITDDASVLELARELGRNSMDTRFDLPIRLVMGDYKNLKVTTPEDMLFGQAILSARQVDGDGNHQEDHSEVE